MDEFVVDAQIGSLADDGSHQSCKQTPEQGAAENEANQEAPEETPTHHHTGVLIFQGLLDLDFTLLVHSSHGCIFQLNQLHFLQFLQFVQRLIGRLVFVGNGY